MKYLKYIENIVNEKMTEEDKDFINHLLINDSVFKEEYNDYITIMTFINEQEKILKDIITNMIDFTFKIDSECFLHNSDDSPDFSDENCLFRTN